MAENKLDQCPSLVKGQAKKKKRKQQNQMKAFIKLLREATSKGVVVLNVENHFHGSLGQFVENVENMNGTDKLTGIRSYEE